MRVDKLQSMHRDKHRRRVAFRDVKEDVIGANGGGFQERVITSFSLFAERQLFVTASRTPIVGTQDVLKGTT